MGRRKPLVPLVVITLLCIGFVEAGYLALEYLVLRQVERPQYVPQIELEPGSVDSDGEELHQDHRLILQRNLFGVSSADDTPEEDSTVDLQEEQDGIELNIVLMGTVDGDTPRAFILDKASNRQDVYEVGDTVQNAVIKSIQRGKLLLSIDGKEKVLDLSEAAQLRPIYQAVEVNAGIEPVETEILQQPPEGEPEQFGSRFLEAEIERVATEAEIVRSRMVRLPRSSGQPSGENGGKVAE